MWLCRCKCGVKKPVRGYDLRAGTTKSCGCFHGEVLARLATEHVPEDMTGWVFGQWTVLGPGEPRPRSGFVNWRCRCSCGEERLVASGSLRQGKSTSCDHEGNGRRASLAKRTIHGLSSTSEYSIWGNMRRRCYNTTDKSYASYGGRGIKICAEWKNDFLAFYADMGPRPSPLHSVDRINVDGNYEPGNCRWATATEQTHNRRRFAAENIPDEELVTELRKRGYMVVHLLEGKAADQDSAYSSKVGIN
jgi:hypothetical protein